MAHLQDIAIIGSSPIQLFLALSLANIGHHITIFNSDSWLGGAWRRIDTPFGPISTHNNIILPLNSQETLHLDSVRSHISSFDITTNISQCDVNLNIDYQPSLRLEFDFDQLLNLISSNSNINLAPGCDRIAIIHDSLTVNNLLFDKCYLSKRFRSIFFTRNGESMLPLYCSNLSHHYIFIFSSSFPLINPLEYTENFSAYFDRASLRILDTSTYCFTARLRRSKKHIDQNSIISEIQSSFSPYSPLPLFIQRNLYSDVKVQNINYIVQQCTPFIQLIDTDQFVDSYIGNFLSNKSIFYSD